jgi:ubiquinone/menaquinone biosynthesis C-methylase UbiE
LVDGQNEDSAIDERPADADRETIAHRLAVGLVWDEVGKWELELLVSRGLRPEHRLLDVGCGSLRGGLNFMTYLRPGHYFGVDISPELLAAGRHEVADAGLSDRLPVLRETDTFEVDFDSIRFDYALAASLFTHLPLNSIELCLARVAEVLTPGGELYATYFPSPPGDARYSAWLHAAPTRLGTLVRTYWDRDPYHQDLESFQWMCRRTELEVTYIGDFGEARPQKILAFHRLPRRGEG